MLIITEKPSVARSFGEALNISYNMKEGFYESRDTDITNCVGHLYELADPEDYDPKNKSWSFDNLPIIPDRYIYQKKAETLKQIKKINELLKKHAGDKIVIATDADREGEVIARIVLQEAGIKDTSNCWRFWVSEALTPDVIQKGMKNLKPWSDYEDLARRGFARQHADWLVGMNITPYETLLAGHKVTLPVGRVQTAIIAAIAQRNQEITNFVPQPYYQGIATILDDAGNKINALLVNPETGKLFFDVVTEYLKNAKDYSDHDKKIDIQTETTRKKANPPKLLSLTELQKIASKKHGYSSSKTLEYAQSLYENHKCLSYPRTPSSVMGDDDVALFIEKYELLKKYNPLSEFSNPDLITGENKHIFNSKKLDSHHALIPLDVLPENATVHERNIYNIVSDRFFMSCMDVCIYDEKKLTILNGEFKYRATVKSIVEPGWKAAVLKKKDEKEAEDEEDKEDDVQYFNENTCYLKNVEIDRKMTKPKKQFTEATLLAFMENPTQADADGKLAGLGTPATRGNILKKIEDYEYVVKEKKNYIATDKAFYLLKLLFKNEFTAKIASISQTTEWEKQLEESPESFERHIISFIQDCVREHPAVEAYTRKPVGKCPFCGADVMEGQKSFFCENIKKEPKCPFFIYKMPFGTTLSTKDGELLLRGKTTEVKTLKSKAGKTFKGKLKYSLEKEGLEIIFPENKGGRKWKK